MGIGNFKGTPGSAASPAEKTPPTPAKNMLEAAEQGLQRDVKETEDNATTAKSYEERLTEAGISMEEADAIRDRVLLEDAYEETVELSPRVSVTFRTRAYYDHVRYNRALERHQPAYASEERDLMLRYYLAASLKAFRGQSFEFPPTRPDATAADEAFEIRHQFVMSLNDSVVSLLAAKLNKFDAKVRLCLSKGAVEDF